MEKRLTMILASLFLFVGMALAQTTVTGTVTSSEDGEPIIGATVKAVGTNVATATDIDGHFTLNVQEGATLEISSIGMKPLRVTAARNMTVVLESEAETLETLVVTGYGSAKKLGSFTGAVTKVDEKKFEKAVTPNFTDALAGQVSGLSVLSSSGDPTETASIRLRGVNSIYSSNTPLFILDGAPISSSMFNTLNPSDIANITVLKDASSTAIYGSRAANGVIVITSKKGKFNEKASLTLRAQYGISSPTSDGIEVMNSQQYMKFRELIGQPLSENIQNLINNYNISTNWRDELLNDAAPTYTLDATVQGGSQNTSYYISANHHAQEGIVDQSGMHRESIRSNIDTRVNKWLKVGLQINLGVSSYQRNSESDASDGIYLANPMVFSRMAMPFDSPYYYSFDENGNIVYGDRAAKLYYSGMTQPWYYNENRTAKRKTVTANVAAYEQITPIEGLTIRAQQSMDGYDYTYSGTRNPIDAWVTPMGQSVAAMSGYASTAFTRYYSFTYTNTAEYKFGIDQHFFTFLLGQESIISKSRSFSAYTTGQSDVRQLRLTDGTTVSVSDLGDSRAETVFNSWFGTFSYNWAEKYFLDLSYRADGSSKFAPDHRWAHFWSIGLMWNAKKENFLKDVDWLNALELRANYGTTGNSTGAGSYDYYGLFGSGSTYNSAGTLYISSPSNYELTWEKVGALDLGFTARIFNRLTMNFDFYSKKTTDMLMSIPYSFTTGFGSGSGNIGAMTNKGFDFDFTLDLLRTKDINWTFKANFNYNKNEITELFAGRDYYELTGTGIRLEVGKPYGEFYYVKRAYIDPRDGKQVWYDADGNLTKVYSDDYAVFTGKQRYAPWSGGFGTQFQWKGLSVGLDFAWQAGKYMINNDNYFVNNANFGTSYNQSVDMLNVWTTPGQVTDVPAYGEALEFDDHLLENASFLRLKNITIQYQFPRELLKYTKVIEAAKVFGVIRNLWTWTKFSGYDPEPDSNLVKFSYPNTRQFVIGLELTF